MAKKSEKFVAYVSTYTSGTTNKCGIKIYDVDMEKGRFTEKGETEITNSSYMTTAHNRRVLYSITDSGVEANEILADGLLRELNTGSINGMRGCYLSTDYDDKFLFVAGYHDGKLTVLRINADGSVGEVVEEIYHKGLGSAAERLGRPHINCARMTRDNKYLCEADVGMDCVNVYELDHDSGRLKSVDIIRCEQQSSPRHLKFTRDGKFLYVLHEYTKNICVFRYFEQGPHDPEFERVETVSTVSKYHATGTAASGLKLSFDGNYLLSTNAGDNSVIVYAANKQTGHLSKMFCLPVSGDYPKDASLFPDNRHLVSLNHESNSLTFFAVDLEQRTMSQNGPHMPIDRPNCIVFHRLSP